MTTTKLIISDLHVADGQSVLECFGGRQQSALEGLLAAASADGPLGRAEDVELIINGDCFDFLVIPPYHTGKTTSPQQALDKFAKITTAHRPFFEALRNFINHPGRHITFITGNHDIELAFPAVRAAVLNAMGIEQGTPAVQFCPTRFYRPLPDVSIEHGNHYDFWNSCIGNPWDDKGQPLTQNPDTITLPAGSSYFQHASHPISIQYPYFDHFEPSMNITRQMALLSLFNPNLVVQTVQRIMEMIPQPRKALAQLAPGEENTPSKLFEHAMLDFARFQQAMLAQYPDWSEPEGIDNQQAQVNALAEFEMLRDTLKLAPQEAIPIICTPATYLMGESVAAGMRNVLKNDPTLRYAIAGHTHMVRIEPTSATQVYLNTASWTTRLAIPAPGELTPELVEWLRHPDWQHCALRDVSQLIFAMVNTAAPNTPSSASLCVWEGGAQGNYHVLA